MAMNIFIMRGVSGSGKSTHAARLMGDNGEVVSADHFFYNDRGEYVFNPAKLPEAHAECLRRFVALLTKGDVSAIVVDNTNTTVAEVAPYAALALAYGATLEIVEVECDVEVAAARNLHGVPLAGVRAQAERLTKSRGDLPPWWKFRLVTGL